MNDSVSMLLVDDRPENLVALEAILAEPGLELVKVNSGEEALSAVLQQEFALVLLDVQMPGMDGFETARLMRSAEKTKYLPIIFVTAIGKEEHYVFEGYESGAVDYLFKPLNPDIVRSKARIFQELYHQRRKIQRQAEELQRANAVIDQAYQQTKQELQMAAVVQQTLLPSRVPEAPGSDFAWKLVPCDELAGDIFDIVHLDEDHVGMYLLDVSGHGVQAALLSCALSTLLHATPGAGSILWEPGNGEHGVVPPGEVLRRLDERFPQDEQTCQYFTMVYGVLDLRSGACRIAQAGHPAPILSAAGGGTTALDLPVGPAVGLTVPNADWPEETVSLQPGDRLFFYSDGLLEAMDEHREEFEQERLVAAIEAGRDHPLADSLELTLQAVNDWAHPAPQDDLSILALHRS